MLLMLPLLTIAATNVYPTPIANPDRSTVTAQTGFTHYVSCSHEQQKILDQNVKDAVALADARLDYINDDLRTENYPQYGHQRVDFSRQAAVDCFGPESQNAPYQPHIFGKS